MDITDEAAAEDEDEGAAAAAEELVGAALRILTACSSRAEGATAICTGGGLPSLVLLLEREDPTLRGNAALCIAQCARDERCLAVLAAQPNLVALLLAMAHDGKGQGQKNAAIALGRLAKNAHCLQAIRDQHGIEILARAMKMGP